MSFLTSIRILPALIVVAALAFGLRIGKLVQDISWENSSPVHRQETRQAVFPPTIIDSNTAAPTMASLSPASGGEESKEEEHEEKNKEEHSESSTHPTPAVPEDTSEDTPKDTPETEWRDSLETDLESSPVQMELFSDLAERRKDLETRERELIIREALIKASESELEQKYKELLDLRTEIEILLEKQSEAEQQRIASLVKIYEGMKAKDAARIFNTLDMDVLLEVMDRMSERKSAPIIAAMNPERARSITIMLAERKRLPGLNEMTTGQ